MENKLVSVIVPIYNAEKFLGSCLDSLVSQIHSKIEIILVNDGSTDLSLDICNSYASKHKNIKVLNIENSGASAARNAGINTATGDYIGFADADDVLDCDMLEYLVRGAEMHSADIAQCAIYFDTDGDSKTLYSPRHDIVSDGVCGSGTFYKNFSPAVWCKIYKRELISDIRFKPYVIGEDMRFNLECLAASKRTVILKEPKYHYIQRESSICYSNISEKKLFSNREMLLASKEDFKNSKQLCRFVREKLMLNNTDLLSKSIQLKIRADEVLREISHEARKNTVFILFRARIPMREKLKLLLVGFAPRIYKRLIAAKK